ncbi:MAG: segregation ATPase FtsK/SpoIIIE, family [Pseudonocardiales bacterium]|jgi:hypothetical protein|nr:segregation ATPase FtsK/SpoIIIE, family [Pseudonocardiales bacterium]
MTEQPAELIPVDPPKQPQTIYATALAVRAAEKRPIVPAWARNRDEPRQPAAWVANVRRRCRGGQHEADPRSALWPGLPLGSRVVARIWAAAAASAVSFLALGRAAPVRPHGQRRCHPAGREPGSAALARGER